MSLFVNDQVVSTGSGAARLGDPYRAAFCLARTMLRAGSPLLAGDTVLTGELGPMVNLELGAEVGADLGPLGTVRTTAESAR